MSREIWGPKIWFILHRISFFSDRTDIVCAWIRMLKDLHEIIPCSLCKEHMGKYCIEHPIRRAIITGFKGINVKKAIIQWCYQFHNTVNRDKGAQNFNKENLELFYGYGNRNEMIADVNRTVEEIEKLWKKVPMRNFKESLRYLLGLISGGTFD